MVTKYMYLGCGVDEFLALTIDFIKEHRAEIGKRVHGYGGVDKYVYCVQVC